MILIESMDKREERFEITIKSLNWSGLYAFDIIHK